MRAHSRLAAWAVSVALASGCGATDVTQPKPEKPEPGAAQPAPVPPAAEGVSDEGEPNNDAKTANVAAFGRPVMVRINPKGDVDCFKVKTGKPGYITVQAKDVPKGISVRVHFSTYDEWKGATALRGWRDAPDSCRVEPGEYYVGISDYGDDHASPEAFPLRIDFLDEMDAAEPNDTAKQAKEFASGGAKAIAIFPIGDIDCYKVKVDEPGYLSVQAKDVPGGIGVRVCFSTWDEWKGATALRGWRDAPDSCRVEPGECYVSISDYGDDHASPQTFPFRVDHIKEMDASEPNDTAKQAKEFGIGETKAIAILPVGDIDVYKVKVDKPGYLSVQAKDVPGGIGVRVCFSTWDEAKGATTLRGWRDAPDSCRVEPGECYVSISDYGDNNASPETFPFRVDFVDEMDAAEPNDAHPQAKEFKPGETKTLAIFPIGDIDAYTVRVPKAGTLKLQAQDVPQGIRL